jgi:GntR family transcriptional regulator, transcriptional repressor for pyruvate dehydrogenase complex
VSSATSSKLHLEAIPRNRVFTEVAKQLQSRIVRRLQPGDMLPPERELARTFGVSRSSIRDAIRGLEAIGLLEPRQGVGTVVRDPSAAALSAPVTAVLLQKRKSIHELLDVRNILEPSLAARAALHATPEQLTDMGAILARQEEKISMGELAIDEDSAFHFAIATAADNSVMLKLVRALMDSLRETRERTLQTEGRSKKSLSGHHRIFAALKRGDAAAAESAMRRHLAEIETIVLNKL